MTATLLRHELVDAIAADRPCGEDLDYTPEFASLEALGVFGRRTPYETPPEWPTVGAKASEALYRSKDLRLLAHLGAAVLRTDGLSAFTDTLTIASSWLKTYWPDIYPRIDEDAILRRTALNCFADRVAIVEALRRAPLVSSPQHGSCSLRDIEAAAAVTPRDGKVLPEQARIDAAFAATPADEIARLRRSVAAALSALTVIDAQMSSESVNAPPDFTPLSSQLKKIDALLHKRGPVPANAAKDPVPGGADRVVPAEQTQAAAVGTLRSRQDAVSALEAVADFFREHEPSSPVPLFVDRAKRLVAKTFLEVLADVAPGAVSEAKAAGRIKD